MELREHQSKAIQLCRESIKQGHKRIMLAAPCSFGKTRVAVEMLASAAKKGLTGLFICDRIKLVQQAIDEFDKHGVEAGVIQGWNHPRAKWHAKIQIASIQTLARRRQWPMANLIIVDEAHVHYKTLTSMMASYSAVPFIGLSATPYAKGLGEHYSDLIVPITSNELMDQGYLAPAKYYGGRQPNVKGIKTKRIQTGGTDFDPTELSKRIEEDTHLVGDIIENWRKYGENSQTIAFSPSINHSKTLVRMFNAAGIPAEHIDGYMEDEERQILYREHDEGKFRILSCSRLLNTGYDAPSVRCMIDAFPTKSISVYCQRVGRVLRLHEDKPHAIILDHAGNVSRHGFAEDICPEELHKGQKEYRERNQTKEKQEPKTQDCPECYQVMIIPRCECGYEVPRAQLIKSDNQILKEIKKTNRSYTMDQKSRWLGDLQQHASRKGYKKGWSSWAYRTKFGVWPNKIKPEYQQEQLPEVGGFIKYLQIKGANSDRRNLKQAG